MDYIEILKYLYKEDYQKNPPEFMDKIQYLESFNPLFGADSWMEDNWNAKFFLTYLFVKFNWVVHQVVFSESDDLADLVDLQLKLEQVKGKFSSDLLNHYTNVMYVLLSSITLYFSDKSQEALAQFNISMGQVLTQAANWWLRDYIHEYMESKAPVELLSKKIPSTTCSDRCAAACECSCSGSQSKSGGCDTNLKSDS